LGSKYLFDDQTPVQGLFSTTKVQKINETTKGFSNFFQKKSPTDLSQAGEGTNI
jgi:hypothetical protein